MFLFLLPIYTEERILRGNFHLGIEKGLKVRKDIERWELPLLARVCRGLKKQFVTNCREILQGWGGWRGAGKGRVGRNGGVGKQHWGRKNIHLENFYASLSDNMISFLEI